MGVNTPSKSVLRAENLGRRFGERWIFRSVDIDLQAGQCLCVLGRNGSGKSTLLRVLIGLIAPSEGKVDRPHRNGIGYSALDLALYPQLTAAEHVSLFARFRGIPTPTGELLHSVELGDARDKFVGAYSTGMRARLKLALATMHAPRILMLDEPTAALDETGQQIVEGIVRAQLSHGAVVIATNDQSDRRHASHELELGP